MIIIELTLEVPHYSARARHLLPTLICQEKLLKLKTIGNVATVPRM